MKICLIFEKGFLYQQRNLLVIENPLLKDSRFLRKMFLSLLYFSLTLAVKLLVLFDEKLNRFFSESPSKRARFFEVRSCGLRRISETSREKKWRKIYSFFKEEGLTWGWILNVEIRYAILQIITHILNNLTSLTVF